MQFNKFLWSNFKETEKGKGLIEYFTCYRNNIETKSGLDLYRDIVRNINYETDKLDDDYLENYFADIKNESGLLLQDIEDSINCKSDINSFDEFRDIFNEIISWFDVAEADPENIPFLSECLYFLYPDYCFPYYFVRLYHRVETIFHEFGIFAPAVPGKNDIKGRFLHYLELCESLYNFRNEFGMDKYELPAFLYGFAVEVVRKYEITDLLSEPRKAFFVGGGKNAGNVDSSVDFAFLDNTTEATISSWNGNPDTQPGDIIVMYCLSPRSYIHSIWRAVTPGFLDPFFYYYKTIYIGKPVLVEPISFNEMINDEVLSQMPLIKAHMQGINGRIIDKIYYDRILELLEKKGAIPENVPHLISETVTDKNIKNEKEVEQLLLEPLLIRLGYKESDWKRQLKLRMGRGDRVYPDYVIFPNEERNNESGHWIWEAKYTISSNKQLKEDFGQAKSYALRLKCRGLGLISKEGVWLSETDFCFEKIKYWSWKQLEEVECFNDIFDIAGNRKRF